MQYTQLIDMTIPNINVTNELDQIVELIAQTPHGIGLDSIAKTIDSTSKCTLQRRLATLMSQKRITTVGVGRALKYLIQDATTTLDNPPNDDKSELVGEVYVPLSAEALEIMSNNHANNAGLSVIRLTS